MYDREVGKKIIYALLSKEFGGGIGYWKNVSKKELDFYTYVLQAMARKRRMEEEKWK